MPAAKAARWRVLGSLSSLVDSFIFGLDECFAGGWLIQAAVGSASNRPGAVQGRGW